MFETTRHFNTDRLDALATLKAMVDAGQGAINLLEQTQDPALYALIQQLIAMADQAGKIRNYSSEIKALRSKTASGTPGPDAKVAPAA